MRLKVSLDCNNLTLPMKNKHIVQGVIYNMFDRKTLGSFYHDQGYRKDDKLFKMFVFSDLFGRYTLSGGNIVFDGPVSLYIDSLSDDFTQIVYEFLVRNSRLYINHQEVGISGIDISDLQHFNGRKQFVVYTLSPVVTYTSEDGYFTYYKPGDYMFHSLILKNIADKARAFGYRLPDPYFKISRVSELKKRIVYFKNTFYEAYHCKMRVLTDYDTLNIAYHTGLSAKGSCGFGMIGVRDEEDDLYL